MKVLIVGEFTEETKDIILRFFPRKWEVIILPPGEEMRNHLEDCQVLIPEHIQVDQELLAKAKQLKFIQTGAGFDNVDVETCTKFGVRVANAAGVNAQAVAEHVMALMFSYFKNIPQLDAFIKNREDESNLSYTGSELEGKTIGIIGMGAVGQKVAAFCQVFGMKVFAYARNREGIAPGSIELCSFDTLVREADIISVHLSLNQQTKKLIDASVFKKMKKQAVFINTARGGIVAEHDLIEALKTGEIAGACLDVFEKEPLAQDSILRDMPNVILTPHTAGMPDGYKIHQKRYAFFVANIERIIKGEQPQNNLNDF